VIGGSSVDEMINKREFHPEADEKNVIGERRGKPALLCGARLKSRAARCRNYAGTGTIHLGYGRCKYCGGNNTGPRSDEGKGVVAQNARKHGFYSPALYGKELETYERLRDKQEVSLVDEIFMWKAKLLTYLQKWEEIRQVKGEAATRVWFKDGQEKAYYYAGTAEDRVVSRNLDSLGRLVEKQARLNPDQGDDMLGQINAELRAASKGKIAISWGDRQAQQRLTPEEAANLI
jgi:hypothetical protein